MAPSFKHRDGIVAAVDCVDWFDFRQKAQHYLVDFPKRPRLSGEYLFRGQSCSSWPLTPSFDRENVGLSPAQRDDLYEEMMAQFKKAFETYGDLSSRGLSYLNLPHQGMSDTEVEALAQHFGLPTRLIDWSHSLYVAAFFAFSNTSACTSGMVSIWTLTVDSLKLFSADHLIGRLDGYKNNSRHLWQQGAFIRNKTNESDMRQLFAGTSTYYPKSLVSQYPKLIRFDIPATEFDVAMDDLNSMRINSMTIFPGIEGVVQWIRSSVLGHR
jgi:hypothetical protein